MFRYISKKSRYLAIVFGIIVLVGVSVYAIDSQTEGYRVYANSTRCVWYLNPSTSASMEITNGTSSDIFVPTKTAIEFDMFQTHIPAGVTTGAAGCH